MIPVIMCDTFHVLFISSLCAAATGGMPAAELYGGLRMIICTYLRANQEYAVMEFSIDGAEQNT